MERPPTEAAFVRGVIVGWERATIRACEPRLLRGVLASIKLLSRYLEGALRPVGVAVLCALKVFLQVSLSASRGDVSDPFPFPSFGSLPGTGSIIVR